MSVYSGLPNLRMEEAYWALCSGQRPSAQVYARTVDLWASLETRGSSSTRRIGWTSTWASFKGSVSYISERGWNAPDESYELWNDGQWRRPKLPATFKPGCNAMPDYCKWPTGPPRNGCGSFLSHVFRFICCVWLNNFIKMWLCFRVRIFLRTFYSYFLFL